MTRGEISRAVKKQLDCWPLAAHNHAALDGLLTRRLNVDGFTWTLQHNPARAVSTAAPVDSKSIAARPCFLCKDNRPAEQAAIATFPGFKVLVNPFPIFPLHLTIVSDTHQPQAIGDFASDFISASALLPDMTVFYNGARCGASAPDHLHFQAVPTDYIHIWGSDSGHCPVYHLRAAGLSDTEAARFIAEATRKWGDDNINAFVRTDGGGTFSAIVVPRRSHRPSVYGTGPGQCLISPGAIDMSGTLILPREADYRELSPETIRHILSEIAFI